MDGKTKLKIVGAALLAVCVGSAFVAYERYQAEAEKPGNKAVATVAQLAGGKVETKIPPVSKYAGLVAVVSGICGAGLLFKIR